MHQISLYRQTSLLLVWRPDNEQLDLLSDEARMIVSEPLGDLHGAWQEVPESHVGIVQPGADELRPFTPSRG